jgi:N-formylglutamate deformylase
LSYILHIPHSSTVIPSHARQHILLSDEELATELLQMTDWYTDELFTNANNLRAVVRFPISRLVLDPERFVDDQQEPMSAIGMGVIYTVTSHAAVLRKEPTIQQRQQLIEQYYNPHHKTLSKRVDEMLHKYGNALVIDCHSFPSKPLPYEFDQNQKRPDICLGTDSFHTPAHLVEAAKVAFENTGFTVEVNSPFSGALVPMKHYMQCRNVSAIMIEVNRALYMDEATGIKNNKFESVYKILQAVINQLKKADAYCY